MVHGRIPLRDLSYTVTLEDVETLNQRAINQTYDISKLSFAAIGHLQDDYGLLRSGAALGRGCGPLIVTRPGFTQKNLADCTFAVPGLYTTANLLLGLYIGKKPDVTPMGFETIMPAVSSGAFDAGVIIHEGRFTYQNHGLEKCEDLGAWWETETGHPIPLGGIAMKRSFPTEMIRTVENTISRSVSFGFDHPSESREYVRQHAQELTDDIINQHIDLYVSDFTRDIGDEGEKALYHFFEMARMKGVIPPSRMPLFAC
jgi:1,4-dihydroxy-6-naphthoate synthase